MRRLLGIAFLGTALLSTVLLSTVALGLGTTLVLSTARDAQADPEATGQSPTPGSLTRYRDRLESEAYQVFQTSVTDPLRRPLAAKGVALWATSSVAEWSKLVVGAAPSLAGVVETLGQRSQVLWREERVIDGYDSLILQLATVHAFQRGLFRVVDGVPRSATPSPAATAPAPFAPAPYVPTPAPYRAPYGPAAQVLAPPAPLPEPRTTAPTALPTPARTSAPAPVLDPSLSYALSAPSPRPTAAVARPVTTSAGPLPRPTVAPTPSESRPPAPRVEAKSSGGYKPTGRGPVWPPTLNAPPGLRDYQGALDREAYRILSPEIEGGMQDALAARKSAMRAAPNVAAWRAELTTASPTLGKAGAVLERRTEVLRGETRVVDTMESEAVQRAAVGGLQAGLERILAQFGR